MADANRILATLISQARKTLAEVDSIVATNPADLGSKVTRTLADLRDVAELAALYPEAPADRVLWFIAMAKYKASIKPTASKSTQAPAE